MEKKYQVFVSSTFKDLETERFEVLKTLIDLGCIPSGMEYFPAIDEQQFDYIKSIIDDCDYYILILAGKYGSISNDGVGFTEKEFDYAISKGIKVLVFLHKNIDIIPFEKSESNNANAKKLKKFRDKASQNRLVKFWTTKEELAKHVTTSLTHTIKKFPAIGWVRTNNSSLSNCEYEAKLNEFLYKSLEKDHIEALKKLEELKSLSFSKYHEIFYLRNKAYTLGELKRDNEAIETFENLISKFQNEDEELIKKEYFKSQINYSFALVRNKRYKSAIGNYDILIEKLQYENDPYYLRCLSNALVNKFEIKIITKSSVSERDFNYYSQLFHADKKYLMQVDMLKILYYGQQRNQLQEIKRWRKEYQGLTLRDWNFDVFKIWASSFTQIEIKKRLISYINIFEKTTIY